MALSIVSSTCYGEGVFVGRSHAAHGAQQGLYQDRAVLLASAYHCCMGSNYSDVPTFVLVHTQEQFFLCHTQLSTEPLGSVNFL